MSNLTQTIEHEHLDEVLSFLAGLDEQGRDGFLKLVEKGGPLVEKLRQIAGVLWVRPCPSWCREDHTPRELDDGVHGTGVFSVVEVEIGAHGETRPGEMLMTMAQRPGEDSRVVLVFDDGPVAHEFTLDGAERVGRALLKIAEIGRAG